MIPYSHNMVHSIMIIFHLSDIPMIPCECWFNHHFPIFFLWKNYIMVSTCFQHKAPVTFHDGLPNDDFAMCKAFWPARLRTLMSAPGRTKAGSSCAVSRSLIDVLYMCCPVNRKKHVEQMKKNIEKLFSYIHDYLVVSNPLKHMKVSWDDDIPNIWQNKTCSKPPASW